MEPGQDPFAFARAGPEEGGVPPGWARPLDRNLEANVGLEEDAALKEWMQERRAAFKQKEAEQGRAVEAGAEAVAAAQRAASSAQRASTRMIQRLEALVDTVGVAARAAEPRPGQPAAAGAEAQAVRLRGATAELDEILAGLREGAADATRARQMYDALLAGAGRLADELGAELRRAQAGGAGGAAGGAAGGP